MRFLLRHSNPIPSLSNLDPLPFPSPLLLQRRKVGTAETNHPFQLSAFPTFRLPPVIHFPTFRLSDFHPMPSPIPPFRLPTFVHNVAFPFPLFQGMPLGIIIMAAKKKPKPQPSKPAPPKIALSESDQQHLASYQHSQRAVIAATKNVISRRLNALYCWGDTGIGKSFNIRATLNEAQENGLRAVKFLSGRCTEPGLLEVIKENSDYVIFIDDDPKLITDIGAQRFLLHLCDRGQRDPKTKIDTRVLTNYKFETGEVLTFTGNIILTANTPLGNMPILRALSGRMQTYPFAPHTSGTGR